MPMRRGCVAMFVTAGRHHPPPSAGREREQAFEAAFEHGRSLSLNDAIAYAVGEQLDRPRSSSPSLDAQADPRDQPYQLAKPDSGKTI